MEVVARHKKMKVSEEDVSNIFRLKPDERRKAQLSIVENFGLEVQEDITPFMAYINYLQQICGFNVCNDIQPQLWNLIENNPDAKRIITVLS